MCIHKKPHFIKSLHRDHLIFLQFSEIIPILIVSKTSGKSSQSAENTDADVSCEEYILF